LVEGVAVEVGTPLLPAGTFSQLMLSVMQVPGFDHDGHPHTMPTSFAVVVLPL